MACGGAPSPAAHAPRAAATKDTSRADYDDPGEARDPATLAPTFGQGDHPTFPRATGSEGDCWRGVPLAGDARRDYDALVARCGAPTGAVPYVRAAFGRLHHALDPQDTYLVHVRKGFCYRFIGVADGTIDGVSVVIERDGSLVGEDQAHGPVAILDPDKAWCMDADGDYRFGLRIRQGDGHYVFGVWARPNSRRGPRGATVALRADR
jgi:hypothetical protein